MNDKVDTSKINWIRMGTTVATNALLERKGAKMALIINYGFKDLLFIGNQARPNIFDLEIVTPDVLYEKVIEVKCRVIPALDKTCQLNKSNWRKVKGSCDDDLYVIEELDEDYLIKQLNIIKNDGIESIAVVLAHSYTLVLFFNHCFYYYYYSFNIYMLMVFRFIEHECRIGEIAQQLGFSQVSLSHEIMPMVRIVPRGFTASADAYLTPHIKNYLQVIIKIYNYYIF